MRWILVFVLALAGCQGVREARRPTWYKVKPQPIRQSPREIAYIQPELQHRDRKAADAWAKILLRNTRAVYPSEVKPMVEQEVVAPEDRRVLLVQDHKFIFAVSADDEIEVEIRVVTCDTGRLLTKPGHIIKLRPVEGASFVDAPIWRPLIIEAGTSVRLSLQVKPLKETKPTQMAIALVMVEAQEQLIRVTRREDGESEW